MAKTKEDILKTARKRFEILQTEQSENRRKSIENIKFTYNIDDAQWDPDDIKSRKDSKRPYLIHNKVKKHVKIVANMERDQRMAQKVKPVDDKADVDIAAILTDYIRSIEHQSDAQEIYTTAGEKALAGGFGYWRILTQYTDDSFDQEIFIKGIDNQYSVYLHHKGDYGFIREGMTKEDFKEKYPNAEPVDFDAQSLGEGYELWFEEDKVFIAEYFYKEPYDRVLAEVVYPDDIDGFPEIIELKDGLTTEMLTEQGVKVLRTRTQPSHKVKWCKMSGNDIVEGWDDGKVRDWVGKDVPIIECKGDEINIEGKVYKMALIEDQKGPQQTYNYWITAQTERVSLFPKAPFLLTPEEIEGHEPMWDNANLENRVYLLYTDVPGKSKPTREPPPTVDSGAAYMTDLANNDIQDTVGRYEAGFGQKSNERTGVAIRERAGRSDMGTYHFPHNVARAIRKTARMLIDIIPKVADKQKMLRLRDHKGVESFKEVNRPVLNPETGEIIILNDLSIGRYDVEEDIKSWSTRREEAAAEMTDAMQYAPMIAPLIAKYKFQYSDAAGAQELAADIGQWIEQQQQIAENEQNIKAEQIQTKQGGTQ